MSIGITPQEWIWLDGSIVPWGEAKLHVISHCLHYGTGIFEGIRAFETERGTAIFRLKEHLDRFYRSGKPYRIEIPFSFAAMEEACKSVVARNKLKEAYIRPIAFKDCMAMGLNAGRCPTRVAVGAWPWSTYLGQAYTRGARCMISAWRRTPSYSLPSAAKACGCYLNGQLAKMEATENGYDEAIMLDVQGLVSEGSGENIFIVRYGRMLTPPNSASILLGITRDTIMSLAKGDGIDVREENITVGELLTSDEVFLTGTAADVTPVVEINNTKVSDGRPGQITLRMQRMYEDATKGRLKAHIDWLTPVSS